MTTTPAAKDSQLETARQNLRLAIAIRGTTAAQVSREAGLSVNALSYFLKGNGSISYAGMLGVCEALEVPIGLLHHPNTITPARLELHSTLRELTSEEVDEVARALERNPSGSSL